MTGILLIAVVGAWLIVSIWITRWISRRISSSVWKVVAVMVLFPALVIAPVADELIGMQQFHTLCSKYAIQNIDEENIINAKVVSTGRHKDWLIYDNAVIIRVQPWIYQDINSKKELVRFYTLKAQGGWLVRALKISETNDPLLFSSSCAPHDERAFISKFNVTIVN